MCSRRGSFHAGTLIWVYNLRENCFIKRNLVHCFIHTFALCAKVLPEKMLSRLKRVIKLANFVKTSAVNTRLLKRFCEDFGSKRACLLNYTEVRWLSRGNATRRLFKLRYELLQFFREKNYDFQADLESKEFVARLAYLSDIFEVLNNFDMSFQGSNGTFPEYISKLALWIENVKNKKYAMFKLLTSVEDKMMNFQKKLSALFCN